MKAGRSLSVLVVVGLLVVASSACSSSGTDNSSSSTSTTAGTDGGATSTSSPSGSSSNCTDAGPATVPDGHWSGPITFDTQGVSSAASGSVTSTGSGNLELEITDGQVTGISAAFEATSTGTMQVNEAQATIDASGTVTDGLLTGTASAVHLEGTMNLTGTMHLTVSGTTVDRPMDGSYPMAADLSIVNASCDGVEATFIPSFNQQSGGATQFLGEASWSGHLA